MEKLLKPSFSMRSVSHQRRFYRSMYHPIVLGNGLVNMFPQQRRIVGGVVFCTVRVGSKESRRLVLRSTFFCACNEELKNVPWFHHGPLPLSIQLTIQHNLESTEINSYLVSYAKLWLKSGHSDDHFTWKQTFLTRSWGKATKRLSKQRIFRITVAEKDGTYTSCPIRFSVTLRIAQSV
jgi:hypothetical protein